MTAMRNPFIIYSPFCQYYVDALPSKKMAANPFIRHKIKENLWNTAEIRLINTIEIDI